MSSFRLYVLILCLLVIASSIYTLREWSLAYPKALGPALDARFRTQYKDDLIKSGADIALVGDSVLVYGVNPDQLAALTGQKIYKLAVPGSASAGWYLALKNIVVAVPHKPRYLVVT